jgi:hypothetical protein
MLLFRSLTLGMLGACLYFLASYESPAPARAPEPELVVVQTPPNVTVIDVARGVSPWALADLVHLDTGEHVRTLDDRDIGSDLSAGAAIALHGVVVQQGFLDIGVEGPHGTRRVIMLLH